MNGRWFYQPLLSLLIIGAICGQQFNSSPSQLLAQQNPAPAQDTRRSEQNREFITTSLEQNQLSKQETSSTHNKRQVNAVFQERFQQQSPHERTISPTTPQNSVNAQIPPSTVHQSTTDQHNLHQNKFHSRQAIHSPTQSHQTFPSTSFATAQQGFVPSPSFPSESQASVSQNPTVQMQQHPFSTSYKQTVHPMNQRTTQIKSTAMHQTVQQAQPVTISNSHVQQPTVVVTSSRHQQQNQETMAESGAMQTFPSQQFSIQNQPVLQQFKLDKPVVSEPQVSQQKGQVSSSREEGRQKFVKQKQKVEVNTFSPEELFEKQAKNAKYFFDSSVTDNIMDNTQIRQEKRDGLELSGLYSYSDGFYKRTVHYKADENGYRVIKEEVEPIGSGPEVNPDGDAVVSTNVGGVNNQYSITAADIKQLRESKMKHG